MRHIAYALIALLLVLAIAGASYQALANRAEAWRFPEPGRLVDIGGFRLKLNCTGSGSPTVILEAGLGDVLIEWSRVQPEIAKFSRVCAYDRAGYGGSDPGPMPRTSAHGKNSDAILRSGLGEQDFEDYQKTWVQDLQMRLTRLSRRGRRVIVPDSGHDIPGERPDAIVNAVRELREELHH